MSASSASAALTFDAGGANRQENIWIDDMTQEEAASLLALNGYKDDVAELIKVCALQKRILAVLASGGLRAGDLASYSQKIQDGRMTLETVRQAVAKEVREDVRRFGEIEIKDLPVGKNILQALLSEKRKERGEVGADCAGARVIPVDVARQVREMDAHAVIWHPIQKRYQFASDFHWQTAKESIQRSWWQFLKRAFLRSRKGDR